MSVLIALQGAAPSFIGSGGIIQAVAGLSGSGTAASKTVGGGGAGFVAPRPTQWMRRRIRGSGGIVARTTFGGVGIASEPEPPPETFAAARRRFEDEWLVLGDVALV